MTTTETATAGDGLAAMKLAASLTTGPDTEPGPVALAKPSVPLPASPAVGLAARAAADSMALIARAFDTARDDAETQYRHSTAWVDAWAKSWRKHDPAAAEAAA